MAEFLFHAVDHDPKADPVEDRRGVHKKGDFWNIKKSGWRNGEHWHQSAYAEKIAIGRAVLVVCDEITEGEISSLFKQYRSDWRDDFGYEIVSQNPGQGRYVVRVFEQNPGAAGQNNLTRAKIETYLTGWGCIDITFTTNSCTFTFSLWNAVRSTSFWERDVSSVVFTLVSYNTTTGVGRISANCNVIIEQYMITHANDPQAEVKIKQEIERKIHERGGTIIGWTDRTLTFEIERLNILTRFREDVKKKAERVYMRHRYNVASADVDAVIAAGGIMTLSRAQILARLMDKMA